MNFDFKLDKSYLLLKMIINRNNDKDLDLWKNQIVINKINKNIIEEIEKINNGAENYFIEGNFDKLIYENKHITELLKDKFYIKFYNETLDHLNSIKAYWKDNKKKITESLEQILRIDIIKEKIIVYISHPKLNTGKCINKKYIFWGHWKGQEDLNYNIIYLCHEMLHMLLPYKSYMPPAMKLYYGLRSSI